MGEAGFGEGGRLLEGFFKRSELGGEGSDGGLVDRDLM